MRRSYGYQHQSYAMQEVQQQSYAMNQQEAWKSKNQYQNQYSDMEIMPSPCIDSQLLRRQNNFNGKQGLEIQQQSHAMNQQEAWKSKNQYQNQYSDMEIMPSPCIDSQLLKRQNNFNGKQGLHQNGWMGQEGLQNDWHGQDMSQNGWHETSAYSSHVSGSNRLPRGNGFKAGSQFSQDAMLNNEMEEDFEYETFNQVQAPSTVRVQEMRYEHSSWGDNGHPRRRNMVMLNGNGCWKV